MQLDKGAHIFLDKPFGLGSAPVMYDNDPDDGCYAISFGYGPSTIATNLVVPGMPSMPNQLTPDEEKAYLTKVSRIAIQL